MGNLVLTDPSNPPLKARSLHIQVEEGSKKISAFAAMPRSGGVLLGIPSRDHGRFHYHLLPKCAPGSTAWRFILLRTWEPIDGSEKRHETVWQTPLVAEADLRRWASSIGNKLNGVELLGSLGSAGFGVDTLRSLEAQGWIPFWHFTAILRRMSTEKRLLLTNKDLAPQASGPSPEEPPNVLLLPSLDMEESIGGMGFRLRSKPEGEFAEYLGSNQLSAGDAGPFYLFVKKSILAWAADLMIETALEVLQDRGLRLKLQELRDAIQASRKGVRVDWFAFLAARFY